MEKAQATVNQMANNMATGGEWHQPLFGCFENPIVCLLTYFFPCIYAGINARDSGCCAVGGMLLFFVPICGHVMITQTRAKTREMYKIPGSLLEDFCVTCFCPCCGIIQNADQLSQPKPPQFASPINRGNVQNLEMKSTAKTEEVNVAIPPPVYRPNVYDSLAEDQKKNDIYTIA